MIQEGYLSELPQMLKSMLAVFLIVLSIGYFLGITFVNDTTSGKPSGIVENYNGNEKNVEAEEMIFKKSKREIYTIIHTHLLSLSVIFLITGLLVYGTKLKTSTKAFLCIEPFVSLLLTFGGIYFIWLGMEWISYIVMISGMFMTLTFAAQIVLIIYYSFIS
jgi:hypothetical protein